MIRDGWSQRTFISMNALGATVSLAVSVRAAKTGHFVSPSVTPWRTHPADSKYNSLNLQRLSMRLSRLAQLYEWLFGFVKLVVALKRE